MRRFTLFLVPALVLFFIGATIPSDPPETPQGLPTINLTIKKVGNTWKVVDSRTDTTKGRAKRNQKIIFTAVGTDAYLQFDDMKLFGGYTYHLKDGQPSPPMVVKNNAPQGTYTYAAFCYGPKVYAEGDSPPKIIVD